MRAPHIDRPICEPVRLCPGAQLRVLRVAESTDAPPNTPFPHYHDVCELVLFGDVRGEFVAEGACYPLSRGCIAFVPSLGQHDFALQGGARDWLLVQADPATVAGLAALPGMEALRGAFCAHPSGATASRIAALAGWLHDAATGAPALALHLAQALLCAAASAPMVEGHRPGERTDSLRRLRPAIERLRDDPANAPGAAQAAALCALSPAYFSRRFHRQLGMAWSEYVRTHRLHLASQWLLESDRSASAIAEALGFSTPSHFGELFRRRFGMSPDAYRRTGRAPR